MDSARPNECVGQCAGSVTQKRGERTKNKNKNKNKKEKKKTVTDTDTENRLKPDRNRARQRAVHQGHRHSARPSECVGQCAGSVTQKRGERTKTKTKTKKTVTDTDTDTENR